MSQKSRIRVVEISERELDGISERTEHAITLLEELAQTAWSESKGKDAKGELADLLRSQAQALKSFMDKRGNEIRYTEMHKVSTL